MRIFLFNLIEEFPGLYFRQIQKTSSIPVGTLDYNLRILKKNNLICDEIIWHRKKYFTNSISPEERKMIGLLRESRVREIIKTINTNPNLSYKKFSSVLKLSKTTINWYLTRLCDYGIIKVEKEKNKRFYSINQKEKIEQLLDNYRESFSDKMLNNFISMWEI